METEIQIDNIMTQCKHASMNTPRKKRPGIRCSSCCSTNPNRSNNNQHNETSSCAPRTSRHHGHGPGQVTRASPPRSFLASEKRQQQPSFLCSGELLSGGRWGCGRGFDWLHDFARHLKTPAGRKCIQPLYDEERQMRGRCWTATAARGSPTSQLSDTDDSEYSSFSALPETFTAALCPPEVYNNTLPLQTQLLQSFPFDLSFVSSRYGEYDSKGSSQAQMELNVEDVVCVDLMSAVDTEPGTTGAATVPGPSYMMWWQSYMGSVSSWDRVGELTPKSL
ncbi:hypothetical protein E4U21_000280 [Claviceps maximensis]|nr:hypothetical protein E4U21_000280 [Claviceps maximensis]